MFGCADVTLQDDFLSVVNLVGEARTRMKEFMRQRDGDPQKNTHRISGPLIEPPKPSGPPSRPAIKKVTGTDVRYVDSNNYR